MALAALVAGCSERAPSAALTTTRDSAGITIVENTEGDAATRLTWTLSAEPVLEIGAVDGAPEYQLNRVWSARRLPGGEIVLVDGGSGEIRIFGPDGRHVRTMGGKGNGPGEFQQLAGITVVDDSLLAYDMSLRRLTAFGMDGGVGSITPIEPPGGAPTGMYIVNVVAVSEGKLVVVPSGGVFPEPGQAALVWHEYGVPYLFDRDGSNATRIGEPVGADYYVEPEFSMSGPFGRSTVSAWVPGRLLVADGSTVEIREYAADTIPSRIMRLARSPELVTEDLSRRFVADRLSTLPEEMRPEYESRLASIQFPSQLPAIQHLHADALGNLWAGAYVLPWAESGQHRKWTVFAPEGNLLGSLDLPADLRVHEIGADYLLGTWRDDLEVEYVRMYSLAR